MRLIAALLATALLAVPPAMAQQRPLIWGDTLPATLDPHAIFDVPSQFILLNAYDGLYRYQGNPPQLTPWLVERHTTSADGLTWEFTLREGVKFHDGTPMTSEDVAYSFRRLLAMNRAPAAAFSPVLKPEGISTPDERTVRFVLSAPYAPFLAALPLVAVVNAKLLQANTVNDDWGAAWLAANDAGSGAYRMDPATYRTRTSLDLERFAEHFLGWAHNRRPIDQVRSRPIMETSTRVLALLRGEIDAGDSYLPTDQVERVERNARTRVQKDESMRVFIIRMNNRKPPFDNLDARLCFAHAFNYEGFNTIILKGLVVRNAGPNPNSLWGNPPNLAPYAFDLAKAKEHCDRARAAGSPIGREIEIHIQSELEQTTQAAQMFQADLRRVGINLKIVPNTWANITAATARAESTPDTWIHWVSSYFIDPENWIGQMYDSRFHGTWKASSWYRNERVDAMLAQARGSLDRAERERLYQEATRIVVAESPDIWVYNTLNLRGVSRRVQGWNFSPVGSGGELRTLWLEN
ncbi:twin-arginine translocation pathway signal protein [Siccirubricoccus deserti]|uniref:ABC transporter substrate-binding protein n=1 Tax=Siccirubricoccus deserti TaxID=2013562 RepID=A0A9X0QZG2_9PROT|nr:ABC transporter substrate-binding protein [Siccirubricoccus deserti]MBC4016699.1 ABC transporter substrate-binding protein [Siccirubricoccus deserti]GGC51198.1 twin-arginine translocation pathway signal protein [Siccirubricoccus deserti]